MIGWKGLTETREDKTIAPEGNTVGKPALQHAEENPTGTNPGGILGQASEKVDGETRYDEKRASKDSSTTVDTQIP
jgi:hypothetical protein